VSAAAIQRERPDRAGTISAFFRGVEQPFDLRVRKGKRVVLALLGAVWLALGVASAVYVAQSNATVESAD
jgi:hypothetical protein